MEYYTYNQPDYCGKFSKEAQRNVFGIWGIHTGGNNTQAIVEALK